MNWKHGEKPLAYLAGAIEHAPDSGSRWRANISKFLISELQHRVFNPCLEESHILTAEEFEHFRNWKTENLPRFREVMHKIIQTDISMLINEVDYIICKWDKYVFPGGGTQGELTMAFWHSIPVYMVSEIPVQDISSWILGCTTEIFKNLSGLKKYLRDQYAKSAE
jgi:hypothetical protein